MNRREFLAAGVLTTLARRAALGDESPRSSLGIVEHCYAQRTAFERKAKGKALADDPVAFLAFCRERGAGGVQMDIGNPEWKDTKRLMRAVKETAMFLEGSIALPNNPNVTQLDPVRQSISACTVRVPVVIRTVVLPGRRYERFKSAAEFRAAADLGFKSLAIIKKKIIDEFHGDVKLAIENHKDWRASELVALLERLDSPNIGVCLDTGNSIALLEDPMETAEQLAPWAFSTHLKDMAVEEYEDGFLLAEVPLGKGFLDLPRIVNTIRKARPDIHFNLEMITRDPLKVPCLTSGYWPTFEEPMGWPLARTLKMVRSHASKTPLPRVSQLDDEARVKQEDDNVCECLKYAREHLGLVP